MIDDTTLVKEVSSFSSGTEAMASVISANFDLAEKVNSVAFIENLQFQLELGSQPDTQLNPLFPSEDISRREDVLSLLTAYAVVLEGVVTGSSGTSVVASVPGAIKSLKSIDYRNFELTHTLQVEDAKSLVRSLSIFEELFLLPQRNERLEKIVATGDTAVKKAALLLYVDIGEIADQTSDCSYKAPDNGGEIVLASLQLCRGGLRAIVDTAFKSDLDTWKSRLSLLRSQTESGQQVNQRQAITQIVEIQKAGQAFDRLLTQTQDTLKSMVMAHESILQTLSLGKKGSDPVLLLQTKSDAFLEQVNALASLVRGVGAATDTLSLTATSLAASPGKGDRKDGN